MSGGELSIIVGIVVSTLCTMMIPIAVVLMMVVGPRTIATKISRWTQGKSALEAYEAIAEGASRAHFQVMPSSFLYEEVWEGGPQALADIVAAFGAGWGREVLHSDADGAVVSLRRLPFLAVDIGWIGVLLVKTDGEKASVRARFRTTYMMPVFTFFLSLVLKTGVLRGLRK